jgi:hypothetical protein
VLSPEGAKDMKMRTPSDWETNSRRSKKAPAGLLLVGVLTQGKPWAKLSWPLRAADYEGLVKIQGRMSGAKQLLLRMPNR